MKPRSLRRRLILGTLSWTAGVLVVGATVGMIFMHLQPRRTLFLHNSFLVFGAAVLVTAGVSVIRGALLKERDERVAKAMTRASDLAHGLKTPLAILAQDADRATATGQPELAESIRQQVARMRRQIDSHLAQARVTASGALPPASASVTDVAGGLVRTMSRLYAERELTIAVNVDEGLQVRVPAEDLEEMLGNLLDNACKWSTSRVQLTGRRVGTHAVLDVDDDGAGLPSSMRDRVLRRGVRADESAPGSGLGLGIVRDLAEAYGGTIVLETSPLEGLRARLTLPIATLG